MKQTKQYQLNLIEATDPFAVTPINENTQALEDALLAHTQDAAAHDDIRTGLSSHIASKSNPHGVTAAQVGAAAASHTHSDYAAASHTHSQYADADHYHSDYYDSTITRSANNVLIAPNGTGGPATFRNLVSADLPSMPASKITSGTLTVQRGGTGYSSVDSTPTSGSSKMVTSGGVYTALQKKFGTDVAGWVTGTYTGNGSASTALAVNVGFQPSAVFVVRKADSGNASLVSFGFAIRSGTTIGAMQSAGLHESSVPTLSTSGLTITSSGFSVTKTADSSNYSLNQSNIQYLYLAFK